MGNNKLDRNTSAFPRRRNRGRPPKFGRPARLVAVTLPHDVLDWLGAIDSDIGRAVVSLHDAARQAGSASRIVTAPTAEIVEVVDGRGLILVSPTVIRDVKGVATIPFGGGRSFLALESGWTTADLELAVVDSLAEGTDDEHRRSELEAFRARLRAWRRDPSLRLTTRTIIVVERARRGPRGHRRTR